jgi:hypothetical protein
MDLRSQGLSGKAMGNQARLANRHDDQISNGHCSNGRENNEQGDHKEGIWEPITSVLSEIFFVE